MFTEPPPTEFDLRFRITGIPVRVHPMFWLVSAMLGWNSNDLRLVLVWVGAVFLSILVHELGHAWCARTFGNEPWVVLYGFGGLAIYHQRWGSTTWEQIAISFCGPLAGFILAAVVFALIFLFGWPDQFLMQALVWDLLVINVFWGLVNLLPVWPLDGGKISNSLLHRFSPARGAQVARGLSALTAGAVALWALLGGQYFLGLFFGFLAIGSMQGTDLRR